MSDMKQQILDKIEASVEVFKRSSPFQYRIRCPFCGDSQKDYKDAHLYLKCSSDPTEPILYNCFLCPAGGRVTASFLEKLKINPDEFKGLDTQIFNKISTIKKGSVDLLTGYPIMDSKQVGYIQKRLGVGLRYEDYDRFKIVWSMETLLPYITDIRIRNTMPNNGDSISFISDDKSTLITRFFNDAIGKWKKTKLFSTAGPSFYTIKATLDLFTQEEIVVNLAEGVMDVISIYKHLNEGDNSVYIATLGSDYEAGVNYVIGNGFIGNNITLKLYIDSEIDEKKLRRQLKPYLWLFNRILMYKNIKYEDFGTDASKIQAIEYQV